MSEQYFTRPNVQPVITNIGTTPEQRQMSTSEFKAKFDEMPEAIQQYIKETLLVELDAFKEEFMTHQADYAKDYKLKTIITRDVGDLQSIPSDITTVKLFQTSGKSDENLVTYNSTTGEFTVVSADIKLIKVTTTITWIPNPNGYRLVIIDLNGNVFNPTLPGVQILPGNVGGSYDNKQPLQQASALIIPSLDDKIRVRVRQNSGASLDTSNRGTIALEVYM